MPPRNKRQRAGALNYRKRKDLARVVEVEDVRVEGSGGEGAGRTGCAEVAGVGARSWSVGAGGSGSVEVEGVGGGGSGSVEVEEGDYECGPSTSEECERDGDFLRSVPRLMRLFSRGLITFLAMTCNTWLCYCVEGYQPYSDSRRLTQLLLLEKFYTKTSAQSGVGWMTSCPMEGSSQSPSKATTLGTTH